MIGFLFPEVCNQQGDQGYKDWLEINGVSTRVVEGELPTGLAGLVVGDVSEQGSAVLESLLANHWLISEIENGLTVLAIGRSGQIISKIIGVKHFIGSQKSQYVNTEFQDKPVYGFINGRYDLDNLIVESLVGEGRLINCALLGPVGIVNPWFEKYCFDIETASREDLTDHYRKLVSD